MHNLPYRSPELNTQSVTSDGTGTALANMPCASVLLQADPDNTTDILIGDSGAQVIQLVPGASVSLDIENTQIVFHKAVSGSPVLNVLVSL